MRRAFSRIKIFNFKINFLEENDFLKKFYEYPWGNKL